MAACFQLVKHMGVRQWPDTKRRLQ